MLGNERLLKKMSVGDILDYSVELYKRNFKKLFMLSLVLYIPFILVYTGVTTYMAGDLYKSMGIDNTLGRALDSTMNSATDMNNMLYRFFAYIAVFLVMGLLYLAYSITLQPVLDASVTKIIYEDAVNGKSLEWTEASKHGFKRFGRLMLNRLLYGLIIYGIFAAVFFIFYIVIIAVALGAAALFSGGSGAAEGAAGVLWAVLGVILFLAFLLGMLLFIGYFMVRFGFGTQSVIIENTSASRAISRSHELTGKKFWHSGIALGTAALMGYLLPTMLGSIASLLVYVDKNFYMLANAATQVIAAIFQPFLTVAATMVFIDLKVRKEGLDLEVKVDTMLEEEKKRGELLQGGDTANA